MTTAPLSDLQKQLQGYVLTTAEITYHLPDYPRVLQTYLWQDYDLAPAYPQLHGFLKFWQEKLDGPLHSVRVAHRGLVAAGEWRSVTWLN